MVAEGFTVSHLLPVGLSCQQTVCGSIANLGSGFDSVGIGVGIYDSIAAEVVPGGLHITIAGEGAQVCALDSNHLVVQGILAALALVGLNFPGLKLDCKNAIPQARGLGSSAAAYAGGLAIGTQLAALAGHRKPTLAELINNAGQFEGHADNSSASILGGAVISWKSDSQFRAVTIPLLDSLGIYLCIPQDKGYTAQARGILPAEVPLAKAVFNLSRSALLVHALTTDIELLFDATDDVLHQPFRRESQSASYELVDYFRDHRLAAFIGGAGPTVVVLGDKNREETQAIVQVAALRGGFTVLEPPIGQGLG